MGIKEKHTGHCNTPDGFFIPCSDKGCKWYTSGGKQKMDTLKREALSILWDKGWTEEEIVKVLRVTLAEVKKYREEQKRWT